jgi:sugar (pentulose or hexulose) kinase
MPQSSKVYLAVDLGASSGRVVAGLFDGRRVTLEEIHRFENGGVLANDHLYWDLLRLWNDVRHGLRAAATKYGNRVVSVGVDTWGVDFALLGRHDELLGNPYCYRDSRTNGMLKQAFAVCNREEIFAETGLQFMELNTLYQLVAMKLQDSPLLAAAESFLMIPDLSASRPGCWARSRPPVRGSVHSAAASRRSQVWRVSRSFSPVRTTRPVPSCPSPARRRRATSRNGVTSAAVPGR